MKLKISTTIFALFTILCLPFQTKAMDAHQVSGEEPEKTAVGIYDGTMDVIIVKGKNYEPREATYLIEDGMLLCDFPQIGKMPGKIRIELPVKINENGTMTAEPESGAGLMKMPMGIRVKLKLTSLEDARVENGIFSFTLSVYGKFMGAKFPTSVHFSGKNNNML